MSAHTSQNLTRTPKNTAFIRAVVLNTDPGKTQGQIYREIFMSKANDQAVQAMASRLWRSPVMQEYADELRAELRERFMVTVESLLQELQEIKEIALKAQTPQCGAAVAAVMGKAKLAGLDKAIEKEAEQATPVRVIIQVEDASHREG